MVVPLAALIPIIATLAPELIKHLAGDRAGAVADRVAEVVTSVAGSTNDADVRLAMADPARAMDMRLELARIAAEQEREEREAQIDRMRAMLADVAGARSQTVDLAKAGSPIAWGAPVVSALVLVAFGSACWLVLTQAIPEASREIALYTVGSLQTLAAAVVSYWVGSRVRC